MKKYLLFTLLVFATVTIHAQNPTLWGTTFGGGTSGEGTIFKITASGYETVEYSFGSSPDGNNPAGTLIKTSNGLIYGTTDYGRSVFPVVKE